jgi:hypothetical protein
VQASGQRERPDLVSVSNGGRWGSNAKSPAD